jgi:tight adherence protein B
VNPVALLLVTLGLLLVSAGVIAAALSHTRAARLRLEKRADLVVERATDRARETTPTSAQAVLQAITVRVRSIFSFGLRYRWGIKAGAAPLVALALVSGVVGWLLVRTLLHFSPWFGASAAIAGFFIIPRQYLARQQRREEDKFMNLFPASIDMMVRMVRAGLTIMGAIRTVGIEAPAPINKVFADLADQVDIGILFQDALTLMGERIGLPDFRFFVVAVSLQHATGGNIAATLELISDIIRKRRAIRLKAKATTAEVRVSSYVLGALPFVVIGGLLLLSPSYLAPLVTDPRGNAIVGAAVVLLILGFVTMREMTRRATRL